MDLIIQMKPYLAFFCMYQLKPQFSNTQRLLLKQLMLLFWFILLPIGLVNIIIPQTIPTIMIHPTNFAGVITAISIVYLYASNYTKKDKIIFLIMLTIGLVSGRSKFYGFYALSIVTILYFENPDHLKINIKNISILTCSVTIIILVAWEKIMLYFGQGFMMNGTEKSDIARFVLYATSISIFVDYLPFGSGLASFATHTSGYYYSPLYSKYDIDNVWGISKNDWSFIADTYYPSLAQFGIVGICLFISFWLYLLKKSYTIFSKTQETKIFALTLLITGYCIIENIADASFTSNKGFFMLMLLGLILSNNHDLKNEISQPIKQS
ncbi:O-antigen ligase domain-containing protein [Parabacteroides massiliensis]|uniref:O-antigen ligase domain-containing protein n=1 Tax=Parabacteroides massiliensis TaxID=1750560 RepID=UPI001FC92CB1|nr:O-antigen ligase domain-containing protein [Parabacteroides massiliensis]